MAFDLSDYNTVPERIAEFREKHPEGSLQAEIVALPEALAGEFIAVKAYAYRTPDDVRPGVGLAYEPFPGKTPYTRDSELQNAETSAWGRAIVAALASDTKKGIASYDEVRNRQEDQAEAGNPYRRSTLRDDVTAADVGRMRTAELAERLAAAGLNNSGTLKAMRERLTEHLAAQPPAAPDGEQGAPTAPGPPAPEPPLCAWCKLPDTDDNPLGEIDGALYHSSCQPGAQLVPA